MNQHLNNAPALGVLLEKETSNPRLFSGATHVLELADKEKAQIAVTPGKVSVKGVAFHEIVKGKPEITDTAKNLVKAAAEARPWLKANGNKLVTIDPSAKEKPEETGEAKK